MRIAIVTGTLPKAKEPHTAALGALQRRKL